MPLLCRKLLSSSVFTRSISGLIRGPIQGNLSEGRVLFWRSLTTSRVDYGNLSSFFCPSRVGKGPSNFFGAKLHRNSHLRGVSTMAPIPADEAAAKVEELVTTKEVLIFSKTYCPFCKKVKALFTDLGIEFHAVELDLMEPEEAEVFQGVLKDRTGMSTVPNVFIHGTHVGGCDDTFLKHKQVGLLNVVKGSDKESTSGSVSYDYDLIVIGGGSGGLAASKVSRNGCIGFCLVGEF